MERSSPGRSGIKSCRTRCIRGSMTSRFAAASISSTSRSAVAGEATGVKYPQISMRSCWAASDQTTSLRACSILSACFGLDLAHVERAALAGIELLDADADLRAQLLELFDAQEDIPTEFFLGRFGQVLCFAHSEL